MSQGTGLRGARFVPEVGSVDLPRERATEGDPERIAVCGTEHASAVPARSAFLRERADIDGRDPLPTENLEDLRRHARLGRDQQGAFANRIEGLHAEQSRDFSNGGIDDDLREIDVHTEAEAWAISQTA